MKYNYTAVKMSSLSYFTKDKKVWIIRRTHYENLCIFDEYFCGYDFMGTANWTDSALSNRVMEMTDKVEADSIIKDLKAADEPAEPEEPKMKLTKEQVKTLNELAKTNWERAQGMLDGMNAILGTKYGWLAKEVVWFEDPDGSNKYAACHDAYCWAE